MSLMFNQTDNRFREVHSPTNAEPMTLGSPPNHLPPYLFGEAASTPIASPTTSFVPSWSTPKQSSIAASQSPFGTPSLHQLREQSVAYQSTPNSLLNTPNPTKSGGPPIQGLLYSVPNQPVCQITSFNNSQLEPLQNVTETIASNDASFSNVMTANKSLCANTSYISNTSYLSPAQLDPFFTQGESLKTGDQLDETWVTVFGFPSAATSYVLQQFSQYGNIVEHKISPNGNWMHLHYQSKLQAKKALSKNGKVFSGNIMIGVKTCIDMDIMNVQKENTCIETSAVLTPDNTSLRSAETTKPNLKNIRPLTQAFQSPTTPIQVTPKSGNTISKAFEYIWKLY